MRMRRIFIDPDVPHGETLSLRGSEAHYLLRVLRLREGDEVTAFDGVGWSCRAVIARAGSGCATLRVLESIHAATPQRTFAVAQALLKAPAMDTVVQRCTELGASAIIGFHTTRSIPRSSGAASGHSRLTRWRALAVEACRQCRSDFIPDTSLLPSLESLVPLIRGSDGALVASLREGCASLSEVLSGGRRARGMRLLLLVGPEGDFSGEELDRLVAHGAVPCRLSDAILRAETAAIAGAALLGQYLLSRTV